MTNLSSILTKHKFQQHSLDVKSLKNLQNESGVYLIICLKENGKTYTPIYADKAKKIKTELHANPNLTEWNEKCSGNQSLGILLKYMPNGSEQERTKILEEIKPCLQS